MMIIFLSFKCSMTSFFIIAFSELTKEALGYCAIYQRLLLFLPSTLLCLLRQLIITIMKERKRRDYFRFVCIFFLFLSFIYATVVKTVHFVYNLKSFFFLFFKYLFGGCLAA